MRFCLAILAIANLMWLHSCETASAEPIVQENIPLHSNASVDAQNDLPVLYTVVDGLALREAPDTEGTKLISMAYGEKVSPLGEKTDFKEKITLRGKVYYTSWIKVRYRQADGKTVDGWAYGGGLDTKAPAPENRTPPKDNFVQELHVASATQIQQLLDLDVPDEHPYSGTIGFTYPSPNDRPVVDGPFRVESTWEVEISRQYTHLMSIVVQGNYRNGQKDGRIEMEYAGYENGSTFTTFYRNGTCQWFEIKADSGEGESVQMREDNPSSCTYNYMGQWMKRNYN